MTSPGGRPVRKGFYIHSSYFPNPRNHPPTAPTPFDPDTLLLGPFCGKPACQFINVSPTKARGVCADAFLRRSTKLVPDVEAYPGHIACDGETKSELVVPLVLGDLRSANQVSPTTLVPLRTPCFLQDALIFRLRSGPTSTGGLTLPVFRSLIPQTASLCWASWI